MATGGRVILGVGTTAFKVSYNAVDLTADVRSVTITQNFADLDTTGMNSVAQSHTPGLRDDSVDIEFFQDYNASAVDLTIGPFLGSTTGATLLIQTNGATVNNNNPSYTMVGSPYTYNPVDGAVGAPSMTKVSFKPAPGSFIVRGTV